MRVTDITKKPSIEEEALKYWNDESNCAQTTACGILDYYGFDKDVKLIHSALKAFGGGMGERSICGSVTGSLAALGIILDSLSLEKEVFVQRISEFKSDFTKEFGTLECGKLLDEFRDETGEIDIDNPDRRRKCTETVKIAVLSAQKVIDKEWLNEKQ